MDTRAANTTVTTIGIDIGKNSFTYSASMRAARCVMIYAECELQFCAQTC